MRFLFHQNAGEERLIVSGESLCHIKALRIKAGGAIDVRNLRDDHCYSYEIKALDRREAELALLSRENRPAIPSQYIHIAWCVVDPKAIERALPQLNELGVSRLTLLWCDKSQRNFRVDLARLERIAIASCEQCGRGRAIEIVISDRADFLKATQNAALLDFGAPPITPENVKDRVFIVGAEGGFGEADYAAFGSLPRFGVASPLVLRSETAALLIAALQLTSACSLQ
ncbi:MAG: 16S rRNA (uracil(1498)-N(3))-methyltransferase [Helicobacteraceae bacterium]|jgi:16S rRNA (uracil1498-N3)-methyltransferase|nr:16S rRNA (uracil(1498)-N(3))-methyltransferase [Helicobacteraceae bacterium]